MRPGSLRNTFATEATASAGNERPCTSGEAKTASIRGSMGASSPRSAARTAPASASTRALRTTRARLSAAGTSNSRIDGVLAASRKRPASLTYAAALDASSSAPVERVRDRQAREQDPGRAVQGLDRDTVDEIAAGQREASRPRAAGAPAPRAGGRRAPARSRPGAPAPSRVPCPPRGPSAPGSDATTRTSVAGAMGNGNRRRRPGSSGRSTAHSVPAGWTSAKAGTCTQRTPSPSISSGGVAKNARRRSPPGRIDPSASSVR